MRPDLSLLLATSLSSLCLAPVTSAQHNVLILIADDLGTYNVGVYGEGSNPPPTPNIDALASRGVLFRNAWSNPVCSPTRACIQTGRYSFRTGVGTAICENRSSECPVLPLEETTIAEMLTQRSSGYAHAAIGKWHLGDERNGGVLSPNLAGWSHFAGLATGAQSASYYSWDRTVNGSTLLCTTYATTQIVDDALSWMQGAPEPWVCYVAFTAPHTPFHAPPSALHSQNLEGLSPWWTPIPFYKAMVEAMDAEIGRLLVSMGTDLVARTNVIFMGDNGTPQQVAEPPLWPVRAKNSPYEGGINVPLIVAGPVVGGPPREEPGLASAVDLFPTVLELCGVPPDSAWQHIDGVSLVPLLRAPGQPPVRTTVFAEWFTGSSQGYGHETIRDKRYKLITYYANGAVSAERYYDLHVDPLETFNLLKGTLTPAQQAALAGLRAEVATIKDTAGAFRTFGGATCVGSAGVPKISGTIPALGQPYTVALTDAPPNQAAALLMGTSNSYWPPLALPFPLSALGGGQGCFLHTSAEVLFPSATDPVGTASVPVLLPGSAVLLAAPIYHSWVISDPAAPGNSLGLTTSEGAVAVIGA